MTAAIDGPMLLGIARGAVGERLGGRKLAVPDLPWLEQPAAAFVTLRRGTQLHGCIGTVDPGEPLGGVVAKHAALAAFEDPRSRPLRPDELDDVKIEISVLGRPEPVDATSEDDAIAKLRPFVDGVILERGHRRAVFLPQVWKMLPDPRAFLGRLKEKAGLPPSFWDDRIQLSRFAVQSFAEPGYGEG